MSQLFREAFKIFDRDKDGYISMKELKKVCSMLGTMLTKEELDAFMAEADAVICFLIFTKMQQYLLTHHFRMEMARLTTTNLSKCFSLISLHPITFSLPLMLNIPTNCDMIYIFFIFTQNIHFTTFYEVIRVLPASATT